MHISAELLATNSEGIVWYDEHDSKPPFKIWCLDDPQSNNPIGEINGTAIVSVPSKLSPDEIFNANKRHVTESFDRDVTELKRRRTSDITPYSGIIERTTRIHVLREFVPEKMERLAQNVSPQMLREMLKTVRTLEQEYRYTVLDRLLRDQVYNLPTLREFEKLERAMLVDQAGKIEGSITHLIKREPVGHIIACIIRLSRYSPHFETRSNIRSGELSVTMEPELAHRGLLCTHQMASASYLISSVCQTRKSQLTKMLLEFHPFRFACYMDGSSSQESKDASDRLGPFSARLIVEVGKKLGWKPWLAMIDYTPQS